MHTRALRLKSGQSKKLAIWGCVAFFVSLAVSSFFYYSGKPFDWKSEIISNLQSPPDNPRGYLIASTGTAISGLLLLPAAVVFYQRLRWVQRESLPQPDHSFSAVDW